MSNLTRVDFHGDVLFAAEQDGDIFVAIKPICEALGLSWGSQYNRVTKDTILSEGIFVTKIPSPGGVQETTLLRLDLMNGFLFGIDEDRVAPEAREKVLRYKRECYRVLYQHFSGQSKGTAGPAPDITRTTLRAMKLIGQIRQERDREVRAMLHKSLTDEMASIGRTDVPALENLGRETPPPPDILRQFWRAYNRMHAAGARVNHSASPGLIALNLNELREHMATHGPDVQIDSAMRAALRQSIAPKFLANKAIRSALTEGRIVKCWVFED